MNYLNALIKWKIGGMERENIIKMVDEQIVNTVEISNEMIDLSLSGKLDDYEFEKILMKFINKDSLTIENIVPVLLEIVRKQSSKTAVYMLNGLNWLVYDLGMRNENCPISDLYYVLDDLYNEAIPQKYAKITDVDKYLGEWLAKYGK